MLSFIIYIFIYTSISMRMMKNKRVCFSQLVQYLVLCFHHFYENDAIENTLNSSSEMADSVDSFFLEMRANCAMNTLPWKCNCLCLVIFSGRWTHATIDVVQIFDHFGDTMTQTQTLTQRDEQCRHLRCSFVGFCLYYFQTK